MQEEEKHLIHVVILQGCTSRVHNIKKETMRASLNLINSSQEFYQGMNGLPARKQMGNVLLCATVSGLKPMYCQNCRVSNKKVLIIEVRKQDLDFTVVSFPHRHHTLIRFFFYKLQQCQRKEKPQLFGFKVIHILGLTKQAMLRYKGKAK